MPRANPAFEVPQFRWGSNVDVLDGDEWKPGTVIGTREERWEVRTAQGWEDIQECRRGLLTAIRNVYRMESGNTSKKIIEWDCYKIDLGEGMETHVETGERQPMKRHISYRVQLEAADSAVSVEPSRVRAKGAAAAAGPGLSAAPQCLYVAGAGWDAVNGVYEQERGDANRHAWAREAGGSTFAVRWSEALNLWLLVDSLGKPVYRMSEVCRTFTPPLGAQWLCEAEDSEPAPTITYLADWVRSEARKRHPRLLKDTAGRGITIHQLTHLACMIEKSLVQHAIVDYSPWSPRKGRILEWESLTMYQVCTYFVLPLTCTGQCSYVESLGEDILPPEWMISHWWGCPFAETIHMLQPHSSLRNARSYWMCTLANNQHNLEELQEAGVMKSPFARVLLSSTCVGTVLLCDSRVTPMARSWCVFEMFLTEMLRSPSEGAPVEACTKGTHFLDIATGIHEGSGGCQHAAFLVDAMDGNWHERASCHQMQFPLGVATSGIHVDICKAAASVQSDRDNIMNYIGFQRMRAEPAPACHPEYDRLNAFVRAAFYSAELFRLCSDMPEGSEQRIQNLLELRADPNKFVRNGKTSLCAVVELQPCGSSGSSGSSDSAAAAPCVSASRQCDVVRMLLSARADPNVASSALQTALDAARVPEVKELLQGHGAREFAAVAGEVEREVNEALKRTTPRGFASITAGFGGAGGGGCPRSISPQGLRCLQQVDALLQRYPSAHCWIVLREHLCLERGRAHRQALAQLDEVEKALRSFGCTNPLTVQTTRQARAPVLKVSLSLASAVTRCSTSLKKNAGSDDGGLQRVHDAFHQWDADGTGSITKEQLARVLTRVDPTFDPKHVDALFSAIDQDGSNTVDYEEFLTWLSRT